jgi:hypothetical protein
MEVSIIAAMKHSEVSTSGEQGGHVQRAHVTDADPPDRFGSNNDHIYRHGSGRKNEERKRMYRRQICRSKKQISWGDEKLYATRREVSTIP